MNDTAEHRPDVSVIVPVWNGADYIAECITALRRQSLPREAYEIIVVDNGSTDATADAVRACSDIIYAAEPRAGSYNARNTGLALARGRHVAFTDADCIADEQWLANGLQALSAQESRGIVAGHVRFMIDGRTRFTAADDYEMLFAFDQQKNVREGACVTANWFSTLALLDEFDGFRADLKSGGDFDLSGRIGRAERPITYAPDAIVAHPLRSDVRALFAKTLRTSGGSLLIVGRSRWRIRVIKTLRGLRTRTVKVTRAPNLPAWRKVRLAALLVVLTILSLYEIVRIAVGGETRR